MAKKTSKKAAPTEPKRIGRPPKPKEDLETLPTRTAGRLLNLGDARIWQLIQAGKLKRGENDWITVDSIRDYMRRDTGIEQYQMARAKLTQERADIIEMDRMVRTGELIVAEELQGQLVNLMTTVRNRLMGIGASLAARLVAVKAPTQIQTIINEAIENALTEFSRFEFKPSTPASTKQSDAGEGDDGGDDGDEAPAPHVRKRVGRRRKDAVV